jgi:hypothetical protein
MGKVKAKVKFTLEQAMNAQRISGGVTTLSLASALDGGGWPRPRPGRFIPGKETQYPLIGSWVGHRAERGISRPLPGFDLRTDHPVGSWYTDYAIPAHKPHGHC